MHRRPLIATTAAALLSLVPVVAAAVPSTAEVLGGQVEDDSAVVAAVNEMLDVREAAVASGDERAWMDTVDPLADAEFTERQRNEFRGWRTLPLSAFRLTADTDDVGDLSDGFDPPLHERYTADEAFIPETRREHRLAGYDDRDALDRLWVTYVRRGTRWYVAADGDLRHLGLDTGRTLWDQGPVVATPTADFLFLSHPDRVDRARELAALAEEASAIVARDWPRPWVGRIPVILPSSVDELETILQSTFDLDNFVAFVSYDARRDDEVESGWEATAPRMYIQDRNLARHTRQFQLETLVHELIHAAAAPLAGPHTEAWVHEGLAEWVTRGKEAGGSVGDLPEPHEFTTGGSSGILAAYRTSEGAMRSLAGRKGADAPVAFFEALGARRVAAGSADHNAEVALRQVAGLGLADL